MSGVRNAFVSRTLKSTLLLTLTACAGNDSSDVDLPRDCCEVTLSATVPEGTGTLYLSGNIPELGPWDPAGLAMEGDGTLRIVSITVPEGTEFEYKFTLGSWDREAMGPSGMVMPNHRLRVGGDVGATHEIGDFKKETREYMADWRGSGVLGTLVYWPDFPSDILGLDRHVEIWLPPGYDENTEARYPVLYMSDGQNLFDPRIANTGVDWGVDEAVTRLVEQKLMPPIIVVGAWNTDARGREYSPWHGAPDYARFLIEELMPRVDTEYRTLTGPDNTAVMGSSMGGLLSFYLVTNHPEVFGSCGCESTHFALSESIVERYLRGVEAPPNPDSVPFVVRDIEAGLEAPAGARYYFAYGTEGLDADYGAPHEIVREWLLAEGKNDGRDFVVREYEGADHNEASWRARIDDALVFMFGRKSHQ
ncbi:MAG: alpha/beta hydrolase-fold protein [marine benthic group bacterium]|nr:alpha/beta hydrolase-fold protein [Gemmatimonadota bacterium]